MTELRTGLWRLLSALVLGWLVVGTIMWAIGSTSLDGLAAALLATVLLSYGVWGMTGRFRLPSSLAPTFVAAHAVLALLFAATLVLVSYGADALATDRGLGEVLGGSRLLAAEFLFWMWLYGLVAAVSYGVRMRERLREHREATARAETLATEARLAALRAHLNPHFLFNALHGVAALIRRDAAEAERAVEQLGSLLRYSLDGGADVEVSLEDEWRFTSTYLDLERMALGDRLRVRSEFSEEALDVRVPSFTLQTLAENAVRHGIAPSPEGGMVTIVATTDQDRLRIAVRDDGGAVVVLDETKGTGLANLRERLDALYAGEALLEVIPEASGGVTARVELPLR